MAVVLIPDAIEMEEPDDTLLPTLRIITPDLEPVPVRRDIPPDVALVETPLVKNKLPVIPVVPELDDEIEISPLDVD
jgi:hypothetical protein